MFVYRNGVYYIDSLQEAVEAQGDNKGDDSEQIYISIPEDKWDEFAKVNVAVNLEISSFLFNHIAHMRSEVEN